MGALTDKRILSIVTGASRGIGRQFVLDLSSCVAPSSSFLITARNESALVQVKQDIRARNPQAKVWIVVCDMGDLNKEVMDSFDSVLREMTEGISYDGVLLVHNAGYLGDVSRKALQLNDASDWNHFLNANFISMVLLNNIVLKWCTSQVSSLRMVVNMSSILAVQAFVSFTQHACGKAAREAFFRGLAVEESTLRVLNYCPGPVLTDMYRIVQEKSYDLTIREAYTVNGEGQSNTQSEVHQQQLTPEETVRKLLKILDENKYESGARIDYFDDEESN